MKTRFFWIALIASLLAACGSSPKEGRTPTDHLHRCPKPRPEACTMDYNPVCGVMGDEVQTFSNGCTACSENKVQGFYLGPCPEPPAADTADEDRADEDPDGDEATLP